MKIAVVGASGMIGSAVVDELLNRGQPVTGIVRNPDKLPARDGLLAVAADLMRPESIVAALRGHDVVVCAFSPGHGIGPAIYKGVVEAGWRIKRAVKDAGSAYLINVGGASSLWTPRGTQMFEDPLWPEWYFNTASPDHLRYLHGVTGAPPFGMLVCEREAILASGADPHSGWTSDEAKAFVQAIAANHDIGEGGRAQLELFRNDRSFDWSFVSPPWFLRPGVRTGKYRLTVDTLPVEYGIPAGISVADLAIAIADETAAQQFLHRHWSAATSVS